MWALEWWPHAILNGQNPLISHVVWTPTGLDLARATSVPAAAIVATPVTLLWGPIVSFNVLSIIAPVLGAFAAYRLCLYLTKAPAPSILAGYLYGFSSYEVAHLQGLLHTVFTFGPPVAALLTLKRLDDAIGVRRYVISMTLLLVVQLLLSTELFLTMTCMGVVSLAAGWAFSGAAMRRRITGLLLPLLTAYVAAAIICSPYVYYALARGSAYARGGAYLADLLSFVVPTPITWLGGHQLTSVSARFPGNIGENGAYLGLPLIAIFVAFVVERWRTVAGRVLLCVTAVAALWALGPRLSIAGPTRVKLPAAVFNHLPIFNQIAPVRLAMYVALGASVAVALWLSTHRARVPRWSLAAVAVVFLLPNTGAVQPDTNMPLMHSQISEPALFSTQLYRRYLSRGEIILPLPYASAGTSMLWQAETGMYFRMASGHFGTPPGDYWSQPIVRALYANAPGRAAASELRSFIIQKHVSAIVANERHAKAWLGVLARLRLKPVRAGGVLVYRVPASWGRAA